MFGVLRRYVSAVPIHRSPNPFWCWRHRRAVARHRRRQPPLWQQPHREKAARDDRGRLSHWFDARTAYRLQRTVGTGDSARCDSRRARRAAAADRDRPQSIARAGKIVADVNGGEFTEELDAARGRWSPSDRGASLPCSLRSLACMAPSAATGCGSTWSAWSSGASPSVCSLAPSPQPTRF